MAAHKHDHARQARLIEQLVNIHPGGCRGPCSFERLTDLIDDGNSRSIGQPLLNITLVRNAG
jgi:hypothetical protein